MNYKALNPSKYFQAALDFAAGDLTLTISRVTLEEMEESAKPIGTAPAPGASQGPNRKKGVVWFSDHPLGWCQNVTNAFCLAEMFGKDTTAWHGKRVTIYATPVLSFGKMEPGIRVRGSPDLASDKTIVLKLMKKKPQTIELKKTGAKVSGSSKMPKSYEPRGILEFGTPKGAQIATLTPVELEANIALGEKQTADTPEALWAPKIIGNLIELREERRIRAKVDAALDSAVDVGSPEPGSNG